MVYGKQIHVVFVSVWFESLDNILQRMSDWVLGRVCNGFNQIWEVETRRLVALFTLEEVCDTVRVPKLLVLMGLTLSYSSKVVSS
ncbi:hypothetical protein V6N13_042482 [Hibiscus sabdariffa]|uniref:Uncharacterized protein n=1 Tax=Hibiscus sabdariffa TaxID=183260 RepID=A0ABR2G4F0_9ROSI